MKRFMPHRLLVLLLLFAPMFGSCSCEQESDDDIQPVEVGEGEVLPGEVVDVELRDEDSPRRLPLLEPAISAQETRDIVDEFSWAETEELAEENPDGGVALHYAMIFVKTPQQQENLRWLGRLWSPVPMFAAERQKWAGQTGALPGTGDGRGVFVFAFLPAKVYNVLRTAALDGEPIYEPVVLRDPPAEVERYPDGALRNDYLFERGFFYEAPDDDATTINQALTTRRQALIPPTVVRSLAEAAQATADKLRKEGTNFLEFFNGKRWVIDVDVLDTDPAFDGVTAAGAPIADAHAEMERAWRSQPDPGFVPLQLNGVRVRLQSGLALAFARLDDEGRGVTDAWGGTNYDICFDMESPAAMVTDFVLPVTVCSFGVGRDRFRAVRGGDDGVVSARVRAQDFRTNLMAQFIDARTYADRILDIRPRKARVLIGGFADIVGDIQPEPRAFAMCNGEANWLSTVYIGLLDGIGAIASTIPIPGLDLVALALTTITSTVLANDIFFPDAGNRASDDLAAASRGVPTHEYGHFVMCEAMQRISTEHLSTGWGDVVWSTLFEGDTGNPENDNLYVNEAWADFFSYQVVGGTNYFDWGAPLETNSRGLDYCPQEAFDATGTRSERDPEQTCLDENSGSGGLMGDFEDRVQRISAIFEDLFDGPRLTREGFMSPDLYPMSDTGWKRVEGDLTHADRWRTPPDDESVVLPGDAFAGLMWNWGRFNLSLGETAILDAMVRTMRDYDYTEAEICQFFALHTPSGDCTELVDTIDVGSIVPAAPIRLDYTLTLQNEATFTWEDAAPVKTGFRWELSGGGDDRSGEEDADTRSVSFDDLLPETTYTFEIWTLNGEQESAGSRRARIETYPTAPSFTVVEARPGGGHLEWTGESPEYALEYRLPGELFREYGTTTDLAFDVDGLRPDTVYEFRVIGISLGGRRGPASDIRTLTTLPVEELWVDPTGDDLADGTQANPIATFAEALTRIDADPTIDAIVLADDVHAQPDFVQILRDITIRGVGNARLDIAGTSPAQGCLPPSGTQRIAPETAMIIAPGTRVTIDNLTIRATQSPTSDNCFGVVASIADRLRMTGVTLELGSDPTPTGCFIGLAASEGEQLTLDQTRTSLVNASAAGSDLRGYGMCASDITSVALFDTDITLGEAADMDGLSFSVAAGMVLENVTSVHLNRSRIQLSEGSTTATGDELYGVIGTVRSDTFFANSLIRTLNGGQRNDAINLRPPTALLAAYHFAFVTAIAGLDDTSAENLADDDHRGAALRLSGLVSRLTTYNSIYAHAAGWGTNARRHSIDFADVSGQICTIQARNNAMLVASYNSVPKLGRSTAHLYRSDAEFSNYLYDVNTRFGWNAPSCTTPSLDIADNFGLAMPNNSAGSDSDDVRRVVEFAPDGRAREAVDGADTWVLSEERVHTGGLPYPSVPIGNIELDLDRIDRRTDQTAIGAYEHEMD